MKVKLTILSISLLAAIACYKTPTYPDEPQIEFVGYTIAQPYTVADTGNLRISFTDGDGDMGKLSNSDSGSRSRVFIRNVKYNIDRIPQVIPIIPQKGTTRAISGTIDIKLAGAGGVGMFDASSCLLLQRPLDTLTFDIYIQDRAGHKSNVVRTSALVTKCP